MLNGKNFIYKLKPPLSRLKKIGRYVLSPAIKWFREGDFRARVRYATYYKCCSIRKKTILYESFLGRGVSCNPYAIFKQLLQDDYYEDYLHIWVINKADYHITTIHEYSKFKNVKFVIRSSRCHLKWLASANYLISNNSLPPLFIKKEGQIYINTWHGVPLKKIGFDLYDGAELTKNVGRSFLQTDYMISDNSFLSDKYINSFKLKNIYEGEIIEVGYPRVDLLFSNRDEIIERLRKRGVKIDKNKEIILYAPTWRGDNFRNLSNDVEKILKFKSDLENLIDTRKYQLLIKPHTLLQELFSSFNDEGFIVPASFDANECLSIVDILIGDFSSLYFDFMILNRPILFYITDAHEYSTKIGTYFTLSDLPAPYTDSVIEIAHSINNINDFTEINKGKYYKSRKLLENADCKNISEKITNIIFRGVIVSDRAIHKTEKIKLLFYKGPSLMNGIGTSLINLLNNIDYSKYDVTVYVYSPRDSAERDFLESIHSNCRVIVRVGDFSATLIENIKLNIDNNHDNIYFHNQLDLVKDIYEREVSRCFNDIEFDCVIQFEGYIRLLSRLAIATKSRKKIIWQHNDMVSEKNLKFSWLENLFPLYIKFDKIVSCAKSTMEVNREKLGYLKVYEKFEYSTNLLDLNRIESMIVDAKYITVGGLEYYEAETTTGQTRLIPLSLCSDDDRHIRLDMDDFDQNCDINGRVIYSGVTWKNGIIEVEDTSVTAKTELITAKFITVGRCSPEKNHMALIDGFEILLKEYPNVMLYIVGHGPQFKKEYAYILKKKLQNRIIMTGNMKNPFGLMKKCDCFIFPSIHEGQGLVVLEARALSMPIILSNYEVVDSVTMENGQLIIGKGKEDIYNGMKEFIKGNVPCDYVFDIEEYNKKCLAEFERLFE